MIIDDGTTIHGLRTRYAEGGVEVYYAYPGALEVRVATGVTMPAAVRPQDVVLGILLADPDDQDPREDRSWRWAAHTTPATRRWAQHVLAADHREQTLVYEHDGEVMLVWSFVPARAHELALLELGFTPAMATWRAPATTETRTLAAKMAQQHRQSSPGFAPPPTIAHDDGHDHADAVEHAWLRWAACMDTRVLKVQKRSYDFRAPPQRDGSALVLHYRTRNADLRLTLDAARHPLIYDVTVDVGDRGKSLTTHTMPGVAWEDFAALVDEIGRIIAGKPITPVAAPPAAPTPKPVASGPAAPAPTNDAWEDVLVATFKAQDARDPQLRLERRLGSGSRIFVLTLPGRRPEAIVGRIDINADLEIESIHLEPMAGDAQATQRRRLESALAVVRQQFIAQEEAPEYATARKKALTTAPAPALVDRLAQHLTRQREAAAVLDMRALARTDLSEAARMVQALAVPAGPSPSETAEWLDDQRLPKSAALLSSYIFTPAVALDTFMADLSASLDAELGTRPASWQSDGTLKILRTTLREGDNPYLLEATGTGVRTHRVTIRDQDDRVARVDMDKAAKGPRDELRLYLDGDFSEETIHEVWARYDALLQSLLRAPVQLEDLRQLLLVTAELVDAPKCQGTARSNAQRALEAARAHYADARTQLQRGRDARALDRLREVLRAVVQVAHNSAEHCAAGQTALLDLASSANHA